MDIKSQYVFIAVMLFLKQPFIFGDDCKCEGLVNAFKSTMSREIFDLKIENTMLQARMDKMESMLQEKSSSTTSRGLDTARLEGFENRLSSIESNKQHTIKVPTNTLKLHSLIAKALGSEKVKRIQAESDTRKQMQFFNQSISDLKIKVDFMLNSNLTYTVDDIEKVERGLHQVKKDIRNLQSNISELQIQTNALSGNVISELGIDLAAINQSVATDIAEIDQRMSDGLLNVKNEIKTMQSKVKKQYQVNVLIDKNVTALETALSKTDQDVLTVKADIKTLKERSIILLKANQCPELPSIRNGEISQNTNEGVRNFYGSVAEYTCNIGYYLNGNTELNVYERVCQADGTWDGEPPICDVPRCEQILDFYGGDVAYLGDRKVYSQAVYRCDDAFSLIPRPVSVSECDDTLRWIPDPPNCYKKAKKEIPANGFSPQGSSGILLHKESYRVHCYTNYELKSGAKYLDRTREVIVNINGTLEPKLECVEERCDPSKQYQTNVKYENGTEVQEKFPSQTDVFLSCKSGYDYYRGDRPMQTPLKSTCVKGNIKYAPRCQEAWCLFSGYPNNEDTFHRVYRADARLVAEDQYIYPRETIEVFCKKGYEMYINSSKSYWHQEFNSECRYGQFSETKEKFPICLEKRCDPDDLSNAVVKDKKGERIRTKIPSRTEVYLLCQNGYEYYSNGRPMNKPVIRECVKGTITNAPECEEKKCLLSGYPNNKDTYHQSDGRKVAVGQYIDHGKKISVKCDSGYSPSEEMTTTCRYGEWENQQFPECVPKPCRLTLFDGTSFWVDSQLLTKANGGTHIFDNGTKLQIACDNGYKMEDMNSKKTVNNILRYSTCSLGSWTNRYKCIPEGCSVPTVSNARVQQKAASKYKHMEEITVVCKKRFHFNQTVTTKVTKFETTCNLGNWTDNIPQECIPDGCQLVIHKGSNYYLANTNESITNAGLMEHGTEIQLQCTERFDLFDDKNNIFLDKNNMPTVICYQGEWKNKHFCKEVICDPKCLHGGKCVGPGKCVCPEGRFGSNCEQAGCILPENAPKVKSQKMFYRPREKVTDFECEYDEIISSTTGMTCLEDGSWSNSVQCLKAMVYLIRVKTDDRYFKGVGTDAKVYIYLHGRAGRTNKLNLQGGFERNDLDETRVKALDVRPITYVRIGHDGSEGNADWCIQFVSIFVENMNEYYVFRKSGPVWVYKNEDVQLQRSECVLAFDKGRNERPNWEDNRENVRKYIGGGETMSHRTCLQKCTELSAFRCKAVTYNQLHKTCWGFAYSHHDYFSPRKKDNWKSHVYRPYCLYE